MVKTAPRPIAQRSDWQLAARRARVSRLPVCQSAAAAWRAVAWRGVSCLPCPTGAQAARQALRPLAAIAVTLALLSRAPCAEHLPFFTRRPLLHLRVIPDE